MLFAAASISVGCASIARVDRIESQIERSQLRLYEKLSDAYFMLGYEYYTLAAEAEDSRQPDFRIRDLRTRAKMYSLFQQDLQKTANDLRKNIAARQAPQAAQIPAVQPAAAFAPAPDPAILAPPAPPPPARQ